MRFEFFRLRFHFEAVDPVGFVPGGAANAVRGALGYALRDVACLCASSHHNEDCSYARIFEPRSLPGTGPSGFAERPRPFALRTRHLDGQTFAPGTSFHLDVHLFDLRDPGAVHFVNAFSLHRRARLTLVEQLDAGDRLLGRIWEGGKCASLFEPASVPLAANGPVSSLGIRFLSPTELKCHGGLAERPEFPVLFGRIRDRISTLRALYGDGPLEIDFREMAARASTIEMTRCQVTSARTERRSSRTGQVHPLGGFMGEAEYRGDLGEFLPYLRAACWTGVGRQTVWGKGEIALVA